MKMALHSFEWWPVHSLDEDIGGDDEVSEDEVREFSTEEIVNYRRVFQEFVDCQRMIAARFGLEANDPPSEVM